MRAKGLRSGLGFSERDATRMEGDSHRLHHFQKPRDASRRFGVFQFMRMKWPISLELTPSFSLC